MVILLVPIIRGRRPLQLNIDRAGAGAGGQCASDYGSKARRPRTFTIQKSYRNPVKYKKRGSTASRKGASFQNQVRGYREPVDIYFRILIITREKSCLISNMSVS